MPDSNVPSPEVIREFPDRGTLWLLEDPGMLQDLLRVVEPELAERLDFTRAERVNRSFVPEDLQKLESDLIFSVPVRPGPVASRRPVWVYLLLEHQSKPDPLMPLRLLSYMVEIWRSQRREWADSRTPARQRRLRPVIPLVFYTGRRTWRTPLRLADLLDVPTGLERFVPAWETLLLSLHGTSPDALTRFSSAVGYALRALQAEQSPREELEGVLREAMTGLEGLPEEQAGQWLRAAWFLVLMLYHRREQAEYTELGALVEERARTSKFRLEEAIETMGRSMAQVVADQARAQTLRQMLGQVLSKRFGGVPVTVQSSLEGADSKTLEAWFSRALDADTLAEVGIPGD